jgi:hypothetical protein
MEKINFKRTNLQWIVDYDYERSACTCKAYERGDYCRCTAIEHAWIDNINVNEVIKQLYETHSRTDSDIDEYCFDRICSAFKIYDKDYYEIEAGYGYYGEEVYGVYFDNEEKIFDAYYEVIALETSIEKIKYCLKLEYNYLIDRVESASLAHILRMSPSNIRFPQTEYFIKLESNVIEDYKDRRLPVAVCVRDEGCYRLIDGYHRYIANKDKETVDIIVLE